MDAIATVLRSPALYISTVVAALACALVFGIRNEGWLPPFRQLRIRRVLLLALFAWGVAVLAHSITHGG